ncbi:hypothetical protein ACJMK2_002918 [Sinanodonta woodiana]|uniref:Carbonic anhydrase n=1 Tax=Sinanodonta woodiana TaxID=1069815 RepID=A0ABD3XXC1_SINWO
MNLFYILGSGSQWGYEGDNGPSSWHNDFPLCAGYRQSPISIRTKEAVMNNDWLSPIKIRGYISPEKLQMYLINNGHTVQINLQGAPIYITGGGLKNVYIAQQIHFHWGKTNARGSEHNIDGRYFPMEMHIVSYNTKYNNFVNALDKEGGLAVLAFMFEIGEHNSNFDRIINLIPDPGGKYSFHLKIIFECETVQMDTFDLRELLPETLDGYCHYSGSLTTPPCYESVKWFIFYETIEISRRQLNAFRQSALPDDANEPIKLFKEHFRPPQPLNGRKIYCHKKDW